jgi:predicted MFS family arabinose efflux permease
MNLIGRWADRVGKLRVFRRVSLACAVPILVLTHLPRVPLVAALATTTVFMICMSGRMVPAMAMMTASVEPRYRGGFMSINSSVQQFASGVGAYLAGHILAENAEGAMTHFGVVGLISVGLAYTCIALARHVRAPSGPDVIAPPMSVEQW